MSSSNMFGSSYEVVGNSTADLLLKTSGKVKIQWGNKFIDLIKDGKINVNSQIIYQVNTVDDIRNKPGIYITNDQSVYLKFKDSIINLQGNEDTYVSFMIEQNTSSDQKEKALKNIGFVYDTIEEVDEQSVQNGIIYSINQETLYIISDGKVYPYSAPIKLPFTEQFTISKQDYTKGALVISGYGINNSLAFDQLYIYSEEQQSVIDCSTELVFVIGNNYVLQISPLETLINNTVKTNTIESINYSDNNGFKLYSTGEESTLIVDNIVVRNGTQGDNDYSVFVNDCAQGKVAIANAITNKGIEASEYDSFADLANKINSIPLPVEGEEGILPANGNILPFYDVYNEMRKAFSIYGGESKYCCAFELEKWSYDNNDMVLLSGADAYYTSDSIYVTTGGEYQFKDTEDENANRYIICFFNSKDYSVPTSMPALAVKNIYCLNGCPRFALSNTYARIEGIYSYTTDKYTVINTNDLNLYSLSYLKTLILCGIEEIKGGRISTCNYVQPQLPDLIRIDGGSQILYQNKYWYNIYFPKLEYINTQYFPYTNSGTRKVFLPHLKEARGICWLSSNTNKESMLSQIDLPEIEIFNVSFGISGQPKDGCVINLPKLHTSTTGILRNPSQNCHVRLGAPIGGTIKILSEAAFTIEFIVSIEQGFASTLNLTGCNGITHDTLLSIINNLADLTESETQNFIMGETLLSKLTEDELQIATNKNWTLS